jgi:hypothetical protein
MDLETKKTIEDVRQAVALATYIQSIPERRRSEKDSQELENAVALLHANVGLVFDELVSPTVDMINDGFGKSVKFYWDLLEADSTQPPTLPAVVTDEYLNNEAIPKLYLAHTTVYSVLEKLEPILDTWRGFVDRAKQINRLCHLHDSQWKADSVFHLVFDAKAYMAVEDLAAVVSAYNRRKKNLESSQSLISRLITLRTSTPTGEISRQAPFWERLESK